MWTARASRRRHRPKRQAGGLPTAPGRITYGSVLTTFLRHGFKLNDNPTHWQRGVSAVTYSRFVHGSDVRLDVHRIVTSRVDRRTGANLPFTRARSPRRRGPSASTLAAKGNSRASARAAARFAHRRADAPGTGRTPPRGRAPPRAAPVGVPARFGFGLARERP